MPTLADAIALSDQLDAMLRGLLVPAGLTTQVDVDRAISLANPGDTVWLDPSLVYAAPLVVTKPITLSVAALPFDVRMDLQRPAPRFLSTVQTAGSLMGLELQNTGTNHDTDIAVTTGPNVTYRGCRVLGDPIKGAKRGIAMNAPNVTLSKCYIADCFQPSPGDDSQAFAAWDSPGPFLVDDCYIEGGSESFLFGGATASSAANIPSGIVIRNSTITKKLAWHGEPVGVKNLFEFKNAINALVTNCDISNVWAQGQVGYAAMVTVRNQDGNNPFATVQNLEISGNRFSNCGSFLNILAQDDTKDKVTGVLYQSVRASNIRILNNIIDVNPQAFGASDKLMMIGAGPIGLTIDGNTFTTGGSLSSVIYFYNFGAPLCHALQVTNNKWPKSLYGVFGDSSSTAFDAATGLPKAFLQYADAASVLKGNLAA